MANDINVTKNTTSGSERWDVTYTVDAVHSSPIEKTMLTADTILDRNIKVAITVPGGTVTAPSSISGSSATVTPGTNKLTLSKTISVTPNVSTAGYISSGTAGNATVSLTADVTTKAATTYTPTTSNQTIASGTYLTGAQTISGDANLVAGNIKTGVSIFGVNGSYSGQTINNQQKSVDPSETAQTVTPDTGYTGLSEVNVSAISSTYVGSGITRRDSSDLSANGATVTAPAGYYSSAASASVSSMTLPTSAAASATSGYTSKATIGRSTSDQYINIPTGYNSAGAYYKVSAVANGSATTPATTITPNDITISVNTTTGLITASNTQKTQSVTPTVSAGYVSSGTAGTITVSAKSSTSQLSTQAGTTITPTESEQTAVAANKYTLGAVKVGAISSTYIGSGITQRDSDDLSASGATVTAPAGYYANSASASVASMTLPTSTAASATSGYTSKATVSRSTSDQYINIPTGYNSAGAYYKISAVPNGSVTAPATISGSSASVSTGTNTITLSKTVSVTPSVTTAGYISSGTAGNSSVSLTASVTTKGATTYHPSTTAQSITSGTYLTGAQTINAVTTSGLTAANIKDGTTVKIGDSSDDDCVTSVIGTFTDSSTVSTGQTAAAAGQILSGYSAWVDGAEVQGNIATVAVSTPTVSIAAAYTPARIVSTNTQSAGYTAGGTTSDFIEAGKLASTTYTPTTSDQTIANSGLYLVMGSAGLKVAGDANLIQSNIKQGVTIFGVEGTYSGQGITLQSKTVSPSTSQQVVTADSGYDALSQVTINAMPAMTLPTSTSSTSSGTSKATISRSTSDQYINIPTGYNGSAAYYKINATPNGSATGPSSLSASSATVSTGTNTITLTKTGVTTTPTVSAGYVSSATASTATVALTASVTTKGATTYTPTTTDQTIASGTYLTGTQTIKGDANLVAGNIANGVTIFGVTGTMQSGSVVMSTTQDSHGGDILTITSGVDTIYLQTKTATPSETQQTISPDSGYTGLSETVVSAIPSNYIGSGVTQRTASDVIVTNGNVNVPVGYYGTAVTKPYPGYGLITSKEYTINHSSTSNTLQDTIALGSSCYTSDKILYVKVRDKAGPRNGYFIGTDTYFYNYYAARNATTTLGTATGDKLVTVHRMSSSGQPTSYGRVNAGAYGVYGYSIDSSGNLTIYKAYNATYSLTINGTYVVEVYLLDYPPTGNPYSYSYS